MLALAVVGEVVETSAMKASEGFTKLGPSILVLLGHAATFYADNSPFSTCIANALRRCR
ncbi:MAG: hypothetical protein EOS27_09300 [Mesorhizobium sp.]|nr:MAG: hypothetical protein EOS27_09300 [Mesorhizobium sp.]TIX25085.1 MAG: hypothetical protein E5V35_15815 [Mesorhizobium sp.]